jgi:hypothetical protein
MKDLDQLLAEGQRVVRFITTMTEEIVPASEELLLFTREQEALTEAEQADCLRAQREFQRGLLLAPVAEFEAEIVLDDSQGVTAEIRRRAADARLRAASLREAINALAGCGKTRLI